MSVIMDNCSVTSKDEYFDFDDDIEKGQLNFKLEGSLVDGSDAMMKELESDPTTIGGLGDGDVSIKPEERVISSCDSSSDDYSEEVRLVIVEEKNNGDFERKVVKEKPKAVNAKNCKNSSKPPRPPRGLSLDSADQKLIRELHEVARLKRARVERMKALKKGKETKTASSKNQLLATLLTILFCLVLLLQGISSRTNTTTSIGESPFSSEVAKQHNIISVQRYSRVDRKEQQRRLVG